MKLCVFCRKKPDNKNKEHVFPKWFNIMKEVSLKQNKISKKHFDLIKKFLIKYEEV